MSLSSNELMKTRKAMADLLYSDALTNLVNENHNLESDIVYLIEKIEEALKCHCCQSMLIRDCTQERCPFK